jgi:hypothetical protein
MRIRWTAAVAAVAACVLCSCAGTPAALLGTARSTGPGNGRTASASHTVTLAARGRRSATLAVVTGAATLTVSATAMRGQLLRVWTPADSGVRPQLVQTAGRVQLFFASTGQPGPSAVSIQLSSAVRWALQFSGGATQTVLELGQGKISSVDFTAGSSLISMALPRPAGTTTITLAGGASQVTMSVPAGVPARLRLYGGAGTATVSGQTHTGVAGGTILTPAGWAAAADRYDVVAPAGVSIISVTA